MDDNRWPINQRISHLIRFWKAYPSVHCSVNDAPCLTVVKWPSRSLSCMLLSRHAIFSCLDWKKAECNHKPQAGNGLMSGFSKKKKKNSCQKLTKPNWQQKLMVEKTHCALMNILFQSVTSWTWSHTYSSVPCSVPASSAAHQSVSLGHNLPRKEGKILLNINLDLFG